MAGHTATRSRPSDGGSARTRAHGGARRTRTRALAGPSTGFAWLRLIGSMIVVIEHSGPILYPDKITIFPGHWIQTPGYIALMGFFAMSGYQISESWKSDPVAWRFMFKRVLRIFPPLLFVVLVTTLVIGPLVTVLPAGEYWGDRNTWGYILNNASLYNIQHILPGVFVDNPYPWSANGSLWTLSMEFTGYLIVLIVGLLGVFRGSRVLLFPLLIALMVGDGFGHAQIGFGGDLGSFLQTPIAATLSFMVAFVVGMIMFSYRDEIPLHGYVALGLLVVYIAVYFTPVARFLMPVMAGYGSIVLAHRWPAWCARYDKWVYGSYGLYVWAFPLQQLIVMAGVRHEVYVAMLAVPAAYLAGLLSWFLVEAPTQQLRKLLPKRRPVQQEQDYEEDDDLDEYDDDFDGEYEDEYDDDLDDDDLDDDDLDDYEDEDEEPRVPAGREPLERMRTVRREPVSPETTTWFDQPLRGQSQPGRPPQRNPQSGGPRPFPERGGPQPSQPQRSQPQRPPVPPERNQPQRSQPQRSQPQRQGPPPVPPGHGQPRHGLPERAGQPTLGSLPAAFSPGPPPRRAPENPAPQGNPTPYGRPTNGQPTNGHPANGYPPNGHSANGHPANGHPGNNGRRNGAPFEPRPYPPQRPQPVEETAAIPRYRATDRPAPPRHAAPDGDVDWFSVSGDIENE